MRAEVLNRTLIETETVNPPGNGDSEKVRAYLTLILQEGRDPVDVVTEIWRDTFRGKLPLSETSAVVDELVDRLPNETQQDLVLVIGRGEITPLTQAREMARKQVEIEERQALAIKEHAQPEEVARKRAPRGQRIHTRREKARKQRELIK